MIPEDPRSGRRDGPREGDFIPGAATRQRWVGAARWRSPIVGRSISFGSMLAIAISYAHNESIRWAILHLSLIHI